MLIKVFILVLLAVIVYCLGSALYYMLSNKRSPAVMAKALTWRIALSLLVFFLLLLGFLMGGITPHGINPQALNFTQPVLFA